MSTTNQAATNAVAMEVEVTRGTESGPPYAYAFSIGGCNPNRPTYRNYLYNVLIAKEILGRHGSTADVVVFIQMSSKCNATQLPEEDARLLLEMNVHVHYVPKLERENFYATVIDKFRILSLVQYRRVLLMDGDVMPLGSLDYLFEMSDKYGVLKENVVVQGSMEPANAGFFMLTPYENAIDEINAILRDRTERGDRIGYPYFDPQVGWGHTIESPDYWETRRGRGTNWTFWAAFSDQGLLYHWVKYHRKSVSILKWRGTVENWGSDSNGTVYLEETLARAYSNFTDKLRLPQHCIQKCNLGRPHSDYVHFTGAAKPWLERNGPPAHNITDGEKARTDGRHYWFWHLHMLNEKLDMKLNFSDWKKLETTGRPIHGLYAIEEHAAQFRGIHFETNTSAIDSTRYHDAEPRKTS